MDTKREQSGNKEDTQQVTEEVEELVEETKEEVENEEIEAETTLSDMTVKELQAIAEEAELPKSEWSKLNKSKLIEYISSKLEE